MAMRRHAAREEMPPVQPILHLQDVVRSFDGVRAVAGLTLDVPTGRLVALIGPNGSGKTTVLNLITGFQRPDSGRIRFLETLITGKRPDQIARLGIGRTFQNIRLFPQISVLDNVLLALRHPYGERLGPALMKMSRVKAEIRESAERVAQFLMRVGLADMRHRLAGELSHGQRRLLELARVMALDSRLILLDEPMSGLFPSTVESVKMMLRQLQESGKTILFIEHNMNVVMDLAEWIIVMDSGAKIAEGRPEEIRENEQVIRSYMGRSVGPHRSS